MLQLPLRIVLPAALLVPAFIKLPAQGTLPADPIVSELTANARDLDGDGRKFLAAEARKSRYFLLGELHGDNEIPKLLHRLWPEMWNDGYRFVAAEVSPWTAWRLESPTTTEPPIEGLWRRQEADDLHTTTGRKVEMVWGCDMEEMHPEFLVRELYAKNPDDTALKQMVELTSSGYKRSLAKGLLGRLAASRASRDETVNDISLRASLQSTLEIESDRADPAVKMSAQNKRELLMKNQFMEHLRARIDSGHPAKVLMRFGRNHLHRGYDARGISTLGNFVAELAIARGETAFNVGAFGTGGTARLMGETFSADERDDEPAFAFLAAHAPFEATIFDLRPLRPILHAIPQERRTALQINLLHWSDAYDSLICYKAVTPLAD